MTPTENQYVIMGYNVEFPPGKRPFPAQFAVMSKVLTALKTEQHALLESPTGSGKTLALLCSSLTFQRQIVKDKMAEQLQKLQDPEYLQKIITKETQKAQLKAIETQVEILMAQEQVAMAQQVRQQPQLIIQSDDLTQATQEQTLHDITQDDVPPTQRSNWIHTRDPDDTNQSHHKRLLPASFASLASENATENVTKLRVATPRIFFCSRTHSQLTQVVKELKTCPMSYLVSPDDTSNKFQTCVLGSKRNLCVNRKYNRDPFQVDEQCRVALDHSSCSYFRKRKQTNDLKRVAPFVWDIEEIVALAQKHRECAYFHSRDALIHANIVFAPYNYLLDPTIRNAMGIVIKDAIIVLDEAHNVEDTCRSSASVEVTHDVLLASIKAFMMVIKHGDRPKWYNILLKVLNGINRWLERIDGNAAKILQTSNDHGKNRVWDGSEALAMLAEYAGITRETFDEIKASVEEVREYEMELSSNEESNKPQTQTSRDAAANLTGASILLGALALTTIQSIINVIEYMFRDDLKYIDDFKLVVIQSFETTSFRSPTKRNQSETSELKFCIWCLNAAVAFSDLASKARSVILTSGTLSPMDSFAGELGTDFPIRLEASHVVNMRKQVFIGAIMRGPGNIDLKSTYTNQQDPKYQDSMGQLLYQYSQSIPGGILMFFPSYSLLHKLTTRWKTTKLWNEIEKVKTIYIEPRNTGKDFEVSLVEYRDTITKCKLSSEIDSKKTGAIFLAVYRGKVSEGIDFSNDNARAVLCVGIPYPSVKELQVCLKRKYQDEKSRLNLNLVNGNKWYDLQAFRALNQALGRCIRHREDYGAIILLDSRHRFNKHNHSLSKWLRLYIQEYEHSEMCVPMFHEFFQRNRIELPLKDYDQVEDSTLSDTKSKRSLVLEYEENKKGKKERKKTPSFSSSLTTVKEFMAKQRQESTEAHDGIFSIFRPQSSK
ncbi:hypothetical protein L917_18991 [Plasmopara halstedii]|uniref:Helicase ATP-binding domain-containing protein n=1 Tax=Plasmopara halstedii TaxID=4781 RepID=A0A0P1AFB1_PLAHL|nr:hypothetical protein L917_18991 [Plasmopara halstedii]CEG39082.1 hypothetical protein L917_18991 [Plasmopara halstedii]|eukprot:XP_024575451.1 hypothetical protein L917_18991 [Plasmopara halstedii]